MGIEVDFLQVGKESKNGQAIALRFGDLFGPRDRQTVIVIDGGFAETGPDLVTHIKKYYGTDFVDLVVSTHPDSDHINGLSAVLMELDVAELWMHTPWDHEVAVQAGLFGDGREVSSKVSEGLRKAIGAAENLWVVADARGVPVVEPFAPAAAFDQQLVVLGPTHEFYEALLPQEAEMSALKDLLFKTTRAGLGLAEAAAAPVVNWVEESWDVETLTDTGEVSAVNESSVVLELRHSNYRLLFTADAGQRALGAAADVVDQFGLASGGGYDVVQIPHHGSRRNVGPTVLNRLCGKIGERERESWFAVSCNAANADDKHPAKKVTNAFTRRGAQSASTVDPNGSIRWQRDAPNRPDWNTPVQFEPLHPRVEDD